MRITVIGTGRMGGALGRCWADKKHTVTYGSRHPERRQAYADAEAGVRVQDIRSSLDQAEVVVLAVPYSAVAALAREHHQRLRDKIVIDVTNPPFEALPSDGPAGAEITANTIGPGARVVAAFKTNFWTTLVEPLDPVNGMVRDVAIAGDDPADKTIVATLVHDLGFRPVDCGSLHNARLLDAMVPLIQELDRRYTEGEMRSSWKLLA